MSSKWFQSSKLSNPANNSSSVRFAGGGMVTMSSTSKPKDLLSLLMGPSRWKYFLAYDDGKHTGEKMPVAFKV